MPTIKDVASRAGVSVGTVSNVLSGSATVTDDLRSRVEAAIAELDYRPNLIARSLKKRQTNTLGMIISDIVNPFFPEMVRGAEDAAAAAGYILTTFNTDDRVERERQVFELLRSRRVDGLLLVVALVRGDLSHVHQAVEEGLPIVCLDRRPEGLDLDSVTADNAGGVRQCIEHLIERGHRRIAVITGGQGKYITQVRLDGYLEAMVAAGLPLDPNLIRDGNFRRESGFAIAKELLSGPNPPTAIFSCNFMMNLGVVQAVEELGLESPRDIALATFDRLKLAEAFRPHMTSVEQPSYEIGAQGTRLLIDRIQNPLEGAPSMHIQLPTQLRIAESSSSRLTAAGV